MEAVPDGSRERFIAKIGSQRKKSRTRIICMAFSGVAAAFAAVMVLFDGPDLSRELERHHNRLAEKENEIMIMAERDYPYEKDMIRNTIRSITEEAIPLEEQLPDLLTNKEKSRILNEYYNQKYMALESLMAEL